FAANVGDACVGSTSGKSGNCIASPYPAQVCLSTNVEDARNNNEACGGLFSNLKCCANGSVATENSCPLEQCKGACATGENRDTSKTCARGGDICCVPNGSGGGVCPTQQCKGACATGENRDTSKTCARGGDICCVPNGSGGNTTNVQFSNPIGYSSVEEFLSGVLGTLQSIIVILALVFIVFGAVMYVISGGDEGRIKIAKGAITAAMIGLAIGLAAPSFLKEIGTVLGWGPVDNTAIAQAKTLTQIASDVLTFLLSIVGVLSLIMLVIGGIAYLTAAGDEGRIESGKKIVLYSIIGILVTFASLVIVGQIADFFVSGQ
ncbi:MAG: hypothetical protein HYV45_01995, partial [Candidatus Moranbacteria bacterium]|nr:hypothetical protein [Candidatus Moranbacteria bacterium]